MLILAEGGLAVTTPDRRTLVTALCGSVGAAVLFALACPPFGFSAAAWAVPGVLLVTARRLTNRQAFEAGFLFGILSAALIARWLPESIAIGLQVSPLAASLLVYGVVSVVVGIPCGLMTMGYAFASRRVSRADLPIVGTFFWLSAEWFRAQFLGWELLGHTQFRELWLIQIADLGGVFAVSFVLILVSLSVAELASCVLGRRLRLRHALRRLVLPLATLAVAFVYGGEARVLYQTAPVSSPVSEIGTARTLHARIMPASFSSSANAGRPELHVRQISTIRDSGIKVSPVLCRDLLDQHLVHRLVAGGADVLINNCRVPWLADANSGASEQHLALAVFRAVESRRFLVRSTNSGDSQLITAFGATRTEPPRGESLTISNRMSHYVKWGDHWILAGFGFAMIAIGRGRRRGRRDGSGDDSCDTRRGNPPGEPTQA